MYLNSTQLTCEYPNTNTTEEFIFELKKHSHVFDSFVEGPIILFEYSNYKVSHIDVLKEMSEHNIIIAVLITFMSTVFMFLSLTYCICLCRRII